MEQMIDNIIRRRDPGGINHNVIRGIILHDIFPIEGDVVVRPIFNLNNYEAKEAELNFRFAKQDIRRLVAALRIPNEIRTRSGTILGVTLGTSFQLPVATSFNFMKCFHLIFKKQVVKMVKTIHLLIFSKFYIYLS